MQTRSLNSKWNCSHQQAFFPNVQECLFLTLVCISIWIEVLLYKVLFEQADVHVKPAHSQEYLFYFIQVPQA